MHRPYERLLFALFLGFMLSAIAVRGAEGAGGIIALKILPVAQDSRSIPLVSVGSPGSGWVIFILPLQQNKACVGAEWVGGGGHAVLGEAFELSQSGLEAAVLLGPLLPEPDRFPEMVVILDGQVRLRVRDVALPATAVVSTGSNQVGGNLALGSSRGKVEPSDHLGQRSVSGLVKTLVHAAGDARGERAYVNALRIKTAQPSSGTERSVLFQWDSKGGLGGLAVTPSGNGAIQAEWLGTRPGVTGPAVRSNAPLEVDVWEVHLPGPAQNRNSRDEAIKDQFLARYAIAILNGVVAAFVPAAPIPQPGPSLHVGGHPLGGEGTPFPGSIADVKELSRDVFFESVQRAWRTGGVAEDTHPGGYLLEMGAPPKAGASHPLLCTGTTGIADVLFWRWVGEGRAVVGLDHWGLPPILGEEFDVPPGPVRIELAMGNLMAPQWDEATKHGDRAYVKVNGRVVLEVRRELYRVEPSTIHVGVNLPGASSCGPVLEGDLIRVERLGRQAAMGF